MIILSHVLGHFDLDFRYNKLLKKIIQKNPNAQIIIVTNAIVNEFKIIQECIWNITDDNTYYIDLKKLLLPIITECRVSFHPLTVKLSHENELTFYRLLETFSPTPLSDYPEESISKIIKNNLYENEKYVLNIPQFIININTNSNNLVKKINLNHNNLWEDIT